MKTIRRSIRLFPGEDKLLRQLYLHIRIPSDQFRRRPDELARFVQIWNELTGRNDAPGEVLHYIVTQRKQKKWVTHGRNYLRLESMPADFLSPREWSILAKVYSDLLVAHQIGSDNLAFNEELCAELARAFARRARRSVPGTLLHAAIMAKRKRGEWVTIRAAEEEEDTAAAFGDIDQVG